MGKGRESSPFQSVVFAGGGCRCFWQVGFYSVVAPALGLAPKTVVGVSAGAAMACMVFSETVERSMEYFKDIAGRNKRNFYPRNLFSRDPAFPHAAMFRRTMLSNIDASALSKLRRGPDIRITISRIPAWMGPRTAVALGIAAYSIEKIIFNPVHPRFGKGLGFRPEIVPAGRCRNAEELADLVLASSCTPPFTPILLWEGRPALDGGLVDNVPVYALGEDGGGTLVMLTRGYPTHSIPDVPGRVYVQPSVPVAITKWDYTSPQGVQDAYDAGRRDGERFCREFRPS